MRNFGTFFIGLVLVLFFSRVGAWPAVILVAVLVLGLSLYKKPSSNNSDGARNNQANTRRSDSPPVQDYYQGREPYVYRPPSLTKKLKHRVKA